MLLGKNSEKLTKKNLQNSPLNLFHFRGKISEDSENCQKKDFVGFRFFSQYSTTLWGLEQFKKKYTCSTPFETGSLSLLTSLRNEKGRQIPLGQEAGTVQCRHTR